jgi:Leu/Phe-tRNA-protein transferase
VALQYVPGIGAVIYPYYDIDKFVDMLLKLQYDEEFCIAFSFNPSFLSRLMEGGFLVMAQSDFILPKIHRERSILFFDKLHIKRSIKHVLPCYELRFDTDFDSIVNRCINIHGSGWLTPYLIHSIRALRYKPIGTARPVSFGLYRNDVLKAGEFGIIVGSVYTSYSGYYQEANAGTVQLILMIEYLRDYGYAFLDLGMPLDYKADLGADVVDTRTFVQLFRAARFEQPPIKPFLSSALTSA